MNDSVRIKKIRTADDLKSAQDSVVIETLNDRYARLNEKWAEAEADLKQFPIPYYVKHLCIDEGDGFLNYLGFVKINGAWRICWCLFNCVADQGEEDYRWCPIAECTLEVRLGAVPYFAALREAVKKAAVQTVADVDKAISDLELALL